MATDPDPIPTLRAFLARYRADYLLYHRSERSLEGLTLFERAFGNRRLDTLTAADVDAWRRQRRRDGVLPSTINRNVGALGGLLSYAVELGVLAAHPLRGMRTLPSHDEPRVRYLDPEEEWDLRDALERRDVDRLTRRMRGNRVRERNGRPPFPELPLDGYADYLTPAVVVTLNTGLRRGELLSLRWTDVDETRLTVRASHAKSGRRRHVPLNQEARAVLQTWRAQAPSPELVFTDARGRPLRSIRKAWAGVLEDAGIVDFRWHDLRHHFASMLVMAGVPLNTVRELLGHATLQMTLRYAHLASGHLEDAVGRLDGRG